MGLLRVLARCLFALFCCSCVWRGTASAGCRNQTAWADVFRLYVRLPNAEYDHITRQWVEFCKTVHDAEPFSLVDLQLAWEAHSGLVPLHAAFNQSHFDPGDREAEVAPGRFVCGLGLVVVYLWKLAGPFALLVLAVCGALIAVRRYGHRLF